MPTKTLISSGVTDTLRIGMDVGAALSSGDVVGLIGSLGAGKTLIIKGMCEALGFCGIVTSPSFSLLNIYSGRITIYHFDLYRLDGIRDLEDIGYEEYFFGDSGVCLVEWADRAVDALPQHATMVHLEILSENERRITIEKPI